MAPPPEPPPGAAEPYAAFVSYRRTESDRRWARWLHTQLETYRVPQRLVATGLPRRLGRVFRDEDELSATASLSERINDALGRAQHLIVVCSLQTPASRWVDQEVRRFQELGRGDRVLALLVEGEPATAFPPALRGIEPLAADVRPVPGERERALRRTALLKLLAGILGVPYDELRRRDEERSRRRLIAVALASTLGAVVLFGLAGFALQQWRRAEAELTLSRAQTLAAQSQIAYSTTLHLGDTDEPLTERGVLLALESLRLRPTVEGDRMLRLGLRKLGPPSLTVPLSEGASLRAVGPKGAWLLLSTEAGDKVFDVETGAFREAREGELAAAAPSSQDSEAFLARSPNGTLAVRESSDGVEGWVSATAEVLGATDGRRFALLPHEWYLRYAAFSADSRRLVTVTGSASRDAEDPSATVLVGSTVRVWEMGTWRKLTEVALVNEGRIEGVAASPEGDWLATELAEAEPRAVLLWPLWPELAREEACRRLRRNLSPSEWQTYLGSEPYRETCPGLPVVSE